MTTIQEQTNRLAQMHYDIDETLTHVYQLVVSTEEDKAKPMIRLLEVNEFTAPSGIMPLAFPPIPTQGLTYPSLIIEITPDEFEQLRQKQLNLPAGWSIGGLIPPNHVPSAG